LTRNKRRLRWAQSSAGSGGTHVFGWDNITEAEAELLLQSWISAYGTYDNVIIDDEQLAGMTSGLAAHVKEPLPGLSWRFEAPPSLEPSKAGRWNVEVRLVGRQAPDELLLLPPAIFDPDAPPEEELQCFASASVPVDTMSFHSNVAFKGLGSYLFDDLYMGFCYKRTVTNTMVAGMYDPTGGVAWCNDYGVVFDNDGGCGIAANPDRSRMWLYTWQDVVEVSPGTGLVLNQKRIPHLGSFDGVRHTYIPQFNRIYHHRASSINNAFGMRCIDADTLDFVGGFNIGNNTTRYNIYAVAYYDADTVLAAGIEDSVNRKVFLITATPDLSVIKQFTWFTIPGESDFSNGAVIHDCYVDEFGGVHLAMATGFNSSGQQLLPHYIRFSASPSGFNFVTARALTGLPVSPWASDSGRNQLNICVEASIARYDADNLVIAFNDCNAVLVNLGDYSIGWIMQRTLRKEGTILNLAGYTNRWRMITSDSRAVGFFQNGGSTVLSSIAPQRLACSLPSGGARGFFLNTLSGFSRNMSLTTYTGHSAAWTEVPLPYLQGSPANAIVPITTSYTINPGWEASAYAAHQVIARNATCFFPVTAPCEAWYARIDPATIPSWSASGLVGASVALLDDGGAIYFMPTSSLWEINLAKPFVASRCRLT
jgi:hypothetical protein